MGVPLLDVVVDRWVPVLEVGVVLWELEELVACPLLEDLEPDLMYLAMILRCTAYPTSKLNQRPVKRYQNVVRKNKQKFETHNWFQNAA